MAKVTETNEAFTERIAKELDKWQDGKRKARVALLIIQDENDNTCILAFGDNRGKNPKMRFVGRMIGIVEQNEFLFDTVLLVAKYACKMRNRRAKAESQKTIAYVTNE